MKPGRISHRSKKAALGLKAARRLGNPEAVFSVIRNFGPRIASFVFALVQGFGRVAHRVGMGWPPFLRVSGLDFPLALLGPPASLSGQSTSLSPFVFDNGPLWSLQITVQFAIGAPDRRIVVL